MSELGKKKKAATYPYPRTGLALDVVVEQPDSIMHIHTIQITVLNQFEVLQIRHLGIQHMVPFTDLYHHISFYSCDKRYTPICLFKLNDLQQSKLDHTSCARLGLAAFTGSGTVSSVPPFVVWACLSKPLHTLVVRSSYCHGCQLPKAFIVYLLSLSLTF